MFFTDWSNLLRLVAVGVPAYLALIVLLRIGGKRTLGKYNAFDLIITIAFGSTLSAGLVSRELSLSEVIGAFVLLVVLQFLITWSSVRWPQVDGLVKAEPHLVLHRGQFLRDIMKRERITQSEVLAAIRAQGIAAVEDVGAVVLETDGTLSVLGTMSTASALTSVHNYEIDNER